MTGPPVSSTPSNRPVTSERRMSEQTGRPQNKCKSCGATDRWRRLIAATDISADGEIDLSGPVLRALVATQHCERFGCDGPSCSVFRRSKFTTGHLEAYGLNWQI